MKNCHPTAVFFLIVFFSLLELDAASQSSWPTFNHDAQHSGVTNAIGPVQPTIKWARDLGFSQAVGLRNPVLDSDGTIYFYHGQILHAVSADGVLLWTGNHGRGISPAIVAGAPDKIITSEVRESTNTLACYDPLGNEQWSRSLGSSLGTARRISTPVVFDGEKIAVASDAKLWTLSENGTILLQVSAPLIEGNIVNLYGNPTISAAGRFHVPGLRFREGGTRWNALVTFDPAGNHLWDLSPVSTNWTADASGTVYAGDWFFSGVVFGGSFHCVPASGSGGWRINGVNNGAYPTVEGSASVLTRSFGDLSKYTSEGLGIWSTQLSADVDHPSGVNSSPIVDGAGRIYVTVSDELVCLDGSNGAVLWREQIGHAYGSTPTLAADGTLYVVTNAGTLYAFGSSVQTPTTVQYLFEEGEGNTAIDSSGNEFDGQLVGGIGFVQDAVEGQFSIQLDGIDDRVDVPPQVLEGLGDRTFQMWVKTTATSGFLFDFDRWGGCCPGDYMALNGDGTVNGHHFSGEDVNISSITPINDGRWHHVALSLSTILGAKLFVDGVLENSDSTAAVPAPVSGNNHFTVGCETSGNFPNYHTFFSGKIDSFEVENVARANIEVPLPPVDFDSDGDCLTDAEEAFFGTDMLSPDTDGDGLLDGWEVSGFGPDENGNCVDIGINLAELGADPLRKDVFVEVDYMVKTGSLLSPESHTHQLKPEALDMLIETFDLSDITLHVDAGSESIMDPQTGELWGTRSRANALDHDDDLGGLEFVLFGRYSWQEFEDIKSENFPVERSLIFHYSISAHGLGGKGTTSGISRGIPSSDFIVSLGKWDSNPGTALQQAGTFMHELGHNFGLRHGAQNDEAYKPNYLSVMNYSFQTNGLIIGGMGGWLDYSRFINPDLLEDSLDEALGLNAQMEVDDYGTIWYPDGTRKFTTAANSFIDWDGDGEEDAEPVSVDINSNLNQPDTGVSELRAYVSEDGEPKNDWESLHFRGGLIGGEGAALELPLLTDVEELTEEQNILIPRLSHVSVSGPGPKNVAPGASTFYEFQVKNLGEFDDEYDLTLSSSLGWADSSGFPLAIPLSPKELYQVFIWVDVPLGTPDGTSDAIRLIARSTTNPNSMDSASARTTVVTPPLANSGADLTIECNSPNGTSLILDGTGSTSPRGTELVYQWMGPFSEGGGVVNGSTPQITLPLGNHTITLIVVDDVVASLPDEVEVTIEDTTAPAVSCSVSTSTLWSPNHDLVSVGLEIQVSDSCDSTIDVNSAEIEVWSDETEIPETGDGSGRHAPDAADLSEGLRLRNERRANEDGRVYLIVVKATDSSGNVGFDCCTVVVPRAQSDDGLDVVLNQAIAASKFCRDNEGQIPLGFTQHGVSNPIGPK